jgi:hypothetical protein
MKKHAFIYLEQKGYHMSELDHTRAEYDRAEQSTDENELTVLAEHKSRYVRARVAGNPATPRTVRDQIRSRPGEHISITLWILGNPACTREEFETIYQDYAGHSYDGNIHVPLAASHHATNRELAELLRMDRWGVTMAVLNNYKGRDPEEYRLLIKHFLPNEDKQRENWKEEEKLAYFRTTGRRHRPNRD